MKRAVLVLTLLAFFLVCLSVNSFPIVRVAEANPYEPPACTILSPKNNTAYSSSSVNFSFVAKTVNVFDFHYSYSLDDQVKEQPIDVTLVPEDYVYPVPTMDTGDIPENARDIYRFSIELHDLSDGQHVLTLNHWVRYFHWFYNDTIVTEKSEPPIIFYINTAAPTITNLSVDGEASGDRLLSFTVDVEASWVGYSLDNKANVTVNGDVVLRNLSAGSHSVTIYAEDTDGNKGASETLYFTVEEPESSRVILVLASTGAVSAVVVGMLVYFKKRKR